MVALIAKIRLLKPPKGFNTILSIHLYLSIYEPNICNFIFADNKYHK